MRPSLPRRVVVLLLDPCAPWWASAGLWIFLAIAGFAAWELVVPPLGGWFNLTVRVFLIVVLLVAMVAGFLRREQAHWYRGQLLRRGAGLCPQCGYALKGLTTDRCPECGVNIPAAAAEAARMTGVSARP